MKLDTFELEHGQLIATFDLEGFREAGWAADSLVKTSAHMSDMVGKEVVLLYGEPWSYRYDDNGRAFRVYGTSEAIEALTEVVNKTAEQREEETRAAILEAFERLPGNVRYSDGDLVPINARIIEYAREHYGPKPSLDEMLVESVTKLVAEGEFSPSEIADRIRTLVEESGQ